MVSQQGFIRHLPKAPVALLGSALLVACTAKVGSTGTLAQRDGAQAQGASDEPTPRALVGKWQSSSMSDVGYTDGTSWSSPSGTILALEFSADGRYVFEFFTQSSLYECTMTILGYEEGSVAFRGDRLTLAPVDPTLTSKDNCHADFNWEKPWEPRIEGSKEYGWSIGVDANGQRVLTLTQDGKAPTVLPAKA